jgi:hypothetical protein
MSASGGFTAEAREDEVVIGASDAMALDAGQILCIIQWLCVISSLFEPSCAPDAVRPLTHRRMHPMSENHLWMLIGVHRTLSAGHRTRPVLAETTIEL